MSAPANTRVHGRDEEDDERAFKYAVDPNNQRVHTTSGASRLATDALSVILQHTHIASQRLVSKTPGTITHADAREQLRLVSPKFNTQVKSLKERYINLGDKAAFTASYTASFAWIQNWIDTDVRISDFKLHQYMHIIIREAVAHSPPERQFLCLEEPNRRDLLVKPVHVAAREAAFAALVGETPAMVAQFREIVTRKAALQTMQTVSPFSFSNPDREMKWIHAWVDSTNIKIDATGAPVLLVPNRDVAPIEALTRLSRLDVDHDEFGYGYYVYTQSTEMLRIYVYAMVKSHGIRAARLAVAWICCVQLFDIIPCEYDRTAQALKFHDMTSMFKWLNVLFLSRNPDTNELDVSRTNLYACRHRLSAQGHGNANNCEIDTILRIFNTA